MSEAWWRRPSECRLEDEEVKSGTCWGFVSNKDDHGRSWIWHKTHMRFLYRAEPRYYSLDTAPYGWIVLRLVNRFFIRFLREVQSKLLTYVNNQNEPCVHECRSRRKRIRQGMNVSGDQRLLECNWYLYQRPPDLPDHPEGEDITNERSNHMLDLSRKIRVSADGYPRIPDRGEGYEGTGILCSKWLRIQVSN